MNTSGPKINPRQQQILDQVRAYARIQFDRVRAEINSGSAWIIATDGSVLPHYPVRLFVALLAVNGAGDSVALTELRVLDRAAHVTIASIPKALLSRDELARWLVGVLDCSPDSARELRGNLARGKDIVPLGRNPRELAAIVHELRCGRLKESAGDPATN